MIKEKPAEKVLIRFDRKHIILILFLLCFFAIAILFRLHGYSISIWRDYIDGSAKSEIIIGKARDIRSDDWAVEIPMMLAQLSHDPKYPLLNNNIGNGLNMLTHSKVPIRHILTVFRPTVWGFFLGADFGLSWMWQTMVFGLFYVFFLVFMIISRNDCYLSLMGSLFLLFSPFFQFWSFHKAEIPIFMGLIFISFTYLLFGQKKTTIYTHAFILGWALSCFVLNFLYPPFQVSCAYLLLFMMVAIFVDRNKEYDAWLNWESRISSIVIALIIFIYSVITYYSFAKDVIRIMMGTVYPGHRFFEGGDQALGIFFRTIFFTLFYITDIDLRFDTVNTNICEASSFMFLFPPIITAILWNYIYKKAVNKYLIVIIGYLLLFNFYIFIGFNHTVSNYSLFYLMHTHRSIMGLGIANAILLVSFLSNSCKMNSMEKIIISFLWFLLLWAAGEQLRNYLSQFASTYYVIVVSVIVGFFTYYLLDMDNKKPVIAILVVISFISTVRFNPIVSGGASFIYENELSKKIIEINKIENNKTKWAAFGDWVIPNLFRMLGVRSINGTHSYPLTGLWDKFDPQRQYVSEYNRYANISFKSSSTDNIKFYSPVPDQLVVYINPKSDILNEMGITHILVLDEERAAFDSNTRFEKLWSFGNKAIFKVD